MRIRTRKKNTVYYRMLTHTCERKSREKKIVVLVKENRRSLTSDRQSEIKEKNICASEEHSHCIVVFQKEKYL
jgi:hypothetical protein